MVIAYRSNSLWLSFRFVVLSPRLICRTRKAIAKDIISSSTSPVHDGGHKHRAMSQDFNNRTAICRTIEDGMECSVAVPNMEQQSTVQVHPNSEV